MKRRFAETVAVSVSVSVSVLFSASVSVWAMAPKSAPTATSADSLVWVSRTDGAKSCAGTEEAQTIDAGAADLKKAKIQVFDQHKGADGKMHAQMCGIPKGTMNFYQIKSTDLPQALSLGYQDAGKN